MIGSKKQRLLGWKPNIAECRENNNDGNTLKLMVETLSNSDPRIYKVSNFLSEYEANHIINKSRSRMKRSTTGNGLNKKRDPTRTSSNTWLAMNYTEVIQSIYHRIGDVLGIDPYKMTVDASLHSQDGVASHLEVVHFATNQQYNRHYDNAPKDNIFLHFITFQVILRVSEDFSGGQTVFPHDHRYAVESEPLSAVFWYNLLDDGNLDENAMYSNVKITSGDMWLFHVSIWDPSLPSGGDPHMPHNRMYALHNEL